ncbi:MAG: NAD-dependent epimerase/dehydratase family protein [Saprospiraceae bacterium]|nr:NAD-dependent epimerase/dehydratase family protein [Saprospiraceae bacterium]
MSSHSILVTGGSGFIGVQLVKLLLEKGVKVRILDLKPPPASLSEVEFIQGSILDETRVRRALQGVSHLYHLAANPKLWAARKETFSQTNYEGGKLVLAMAWKQGVQKIVYTSTEAILGSYKHPRETSIDEGTSLPALNEMAGPYTRSKHKMETWVRAAAREGMPVNIVYPTTPVGPGDYNFTASTQMIFDFVRGKAPAYYDCHLNLIDVRDVARGHMLAAETEKTGERYILGHQNLSMKEILQLIEEASGVSMPGRRIPYGLAWISAAVAEWYADHISFKAPVASLEGVRLARANLVVDAAKAKDQLGLECRPVSDAVSDAVIWLREEGYLS